MCGIIGYIGDKQVLPILIDGLRRLEYRGYDSAGVAVVRDGAIELRRSAGKLARLEEVLAINPLEGDYGIGHTRWATHGRPTEENAHPHRDCTGRIVVVHNGIIENYLDLKKQLQKEGHTFVTETDTEIVAHLVERESKGDGLENAVAQARAAAGERAVGVHGGDTIRQCLDAGLLDEIHIDLVPVLLGSGIPLFGHARNAPVILGTPTVVAGVGVTHLRYAVRNT